MFKKIKKVKDIDKHTHKFIIWAVIWSAILWLWFFSKTNKWKNSINKIKDKLKWTISFFKLGFNEFKKVFKKWKK